MREERKVVTVLFADLVGFTLRSAERDPEDVRASLSPYYARLRLELERFGGTVEKFIGDAVMALFGAPKAHEDDPERAVRSALAIRDWVVEEGSGLQLRIAVNTGEVLVALGAQPERGEGMASGDVVNTTSRLQTAAPVNGILVGEATYRATSHVITYRVAEPVSAKGKVAPVAAWEAVEARSRFGVDVATTSRTPLVGRTHELGVLGDALARVRRDRSPHLVTIVGVPGIGKSRLVAELFRAIHDDPDDVVRWRQGRSLPYGEGVTFWALGEMVKAQAGVLETDSSEQVERKLEASIAELIPDASDAQWVEGHLRPLVGLIRAADTASDRREEAFTAWRRFFEALAEAHPLTLVFEDLHWADDNLLDFIEHLLDWVSAVPLLIVCTARPELHQRRTGWGGGTRHATTLSLSPLSEAETAEMIGSLGERRVMTAETRQALLSRAGGNPLYAEQYVRMLTERSDGAELPLPETVQGIIAARLDALPVEEKSLLQAAAVMGKVFWLGALAQDDGIDRRTAELRLHALERKDFVQRARRSSVGREAEYAFLHVLVRDVAYGQIPRGRRAEQHRRAAQWIDSLGQTEDRAELLAHHYLSALELRRAAGLPADNSLTERALGSLRAAGDHAVAVNAYTTAAGHYSSAVDLASPASPERAHLLFQLGRTRFLAGDVEPELLAVAAAELLACGDRETAAEAEAVLAELSWYRGDTEPALEHLNRARELVEGGAPTRVRAYVICGVSRYLMLADEYSDAIRLGLEAVAMAEHLALDEVRANALINVGTSKCQIGDPDGVADLEQADEVAVQAGAPAVACRAKLNLMYFWWRMGKLERNAALKEEAREMASRFGQIVHRRWIRGTDAMDLYVRGRWKEAEASADEFLAEVEAGSPHYNAALCYAARAQTRLGRDQTAYAVADAERALELARLAKDPQTLNCVLPAVAHVLREAGDPGRAAVLACEVLDELRAGKNSSAIDALHVLAWTLRSLGRGQDLIEVLPASDSTWVQAATAFSSGDLGHAAEVCGAMGAYTEEARDRLWLAEILVKQKRRGEADVQLELALDFYRSVGATRYIREGEELLAANG